jgi:hypothetical protein
VLDGFAALFSAIGDVAGNVDNGGVTALLQFRSALLLAA